MTKAPVAVPTEYQEAVALCQWWRIACRTFRDADGLPACEDDLVHLVNEGHRNPITGKSLLAQGMRPGIPDYLLTVPSGGRPGLWIELKRRKGGHVSEDQKVAILRLQGHGYAACVAKGADEAIRAITEYLRPEAHGEIL